MVFLEPHAIGAPLRVVAVVPVLDGDMDGETHRLCDLLAGEIGKDKGLKVVDTGRLKDIQHYYKKGETDPQTKEIETILNQARDNYYRFKYVEARRLARGAIAKLEEMPRARYSQGSLFINAYLALAIASKTLGDVGEAKEALRSVLNIDPGYRPDPALFPPSFIQLFNDVSSLAETVPRGGIRVTSNAKAADVYINGVLKGTTPLTIKDLPEGKYYVKISANRYTVEEKEAVVKGGRITTVNGRLEWNKNWEDKGDEVASNDPEGDALYIGRLLKADKVMLVDVDRAGDAKRVYAKVMDSNYGFGLPKVSLTTKGDIDEVVPRLARDAVKRVGVDVADVSPGDLEPSGSGDSSLMAKKRGIPPYLWWILGGIGAGGVGAGLALGLGGGAAAAAGAIGIVFK